MIPESLDTPMAQASAHHWERVSYVASNPSHPDSYLVGCLLELKESVITKQQLRSSPRRHSVGVAEQPARPTIEPVPVAERPWEREGWCDAEGRCWWFNHAGIPEWQLASDGPYGDFSLPHHALPVPGAEGSP
jgi:hypothetical protein